MGTCCSRDATELPRHRNAAEVHNGRTAHHAESGSLSDSSDIASDHAAEANHLAELQRLERMLDEADSPHAATGQRPTTESQHLREQIQQMQRMLMLLVAVGGPAAQQLIPFAGVRPGSSASRSITGAGTRSPLMHSGDIDRYSITVIETADDSEGPHQREAPCPDACEGEDVSGVTIFVDDDALTQNQCCKEGHDDPDDHPCPPDAGETPSVTADAAETTCREPRACVICLETFHKGETVRLLPCLHRFHLECVDPWLMQYQSICPVCRGDLRAMAAERRQ